MSDDTSDDEDIEMNCEVEASTSGETESGMKEESKKEKRKYKCPKCDFMARFPNKLRIHVDVRHPSEHRFSCESCDMKFEEYIQLRKHRQLNHPVIHKCTECDFEHKIKANFDKHFKSNHVNGVYCSFGCGKMFAKNQIKKHIAKFHSTDIDIEIEESKEQSTERILKCELCDYEADKLLKTEELKIEDLNIHISRIHGKGTNCPFGCGKSFKVDDLINHIQMEHEQESDETEKIRNEDTVSTCIDVRMDEDENEISDDETEEEREKAYSVDNQCSKCSKIFNCSQSLKRHIKRVHEKIYSETSKKVVWKECDFVQNGTKCEKRFKCQTLLDDHLNKHKNIFPYKCQNCDQKFNARSRFAVHLSKYHKTSIKDYTLLMNSVFRK